MYQNEIDALLQQNLETVARTHSTFLFLDEINEWPTISFYCKDVRLTHIGAGERFASHEYELRAYTWDEDVELSGEALADEIESILDQTYEGIEDIRINTIETDEGLLAPYGVCLINFLVLVRR